MKKKRLLLLLMLVLAVSLALYGCGGSEETGGNNSGSEENNAADENSNDASAENTEESEENTEESSGGAEADGYPERDIEMVAGWGAGGGTDSFARAIAREMEEILGVTINVVNMEGSSGAIAGDYVANQPADGYTIWAISQYTMAYASGLTPHALDTYQPIGRVQADTLTIQVTGDSEFETIDDLVQYAEENPGELSLGGTGAGSVDELSARQFEQATGVTVNYVPYESAGEMHAALLGGHLDAILEEFGPAIDYINNDEIKPLVIWSEDRIEDFPDIPTTVEKGWDLTDGLSRGLMVHADTPDEIVDILEATLEEAKDKERYKEYEQNSYLHLRDGWLNKEDYEEFLANQIENYTQILENMED